MELIEEETIEVIPVESIENEGEEVIPTEFDRAKVAALNSEEQRFTDFFPDENLAEAVAKLFERAATDIVTQEELDALTMTNLPYSFISDITGIDSMSNLQWLNLDLNQITDIPCSIGNLSKLQELYLSNNQITEIPSYIGKLSDLRLLHLSSNQITEIPYDTLNSILSIEYIHLYNQTAQLNPIAIDLGSTIEYRNLIPLFVQHLQRLNEGQLKGLWVIYKPDGSDITIEDDLQNAMNQFVFEQIGEYLVEYHVPSNMGYNINEKSIYDLKYTTRITTTTLIVNDTTFTAQYEKIKFVQVRYIAGRGMMIQGSSREVVEKGGKPTNVPIVKHPLDEFIGWKNQAGNFVDPATVIVTKNVIFTAYYEIDEN